MQGVVIPAVIESVSSRRDKTLKIVIGTNEVSPQKGGTLFSMQNHICQVYIKSEEITTNEIEQVDKVKVDFGGKSQSERLRNVLFLLFRQNDEGFTSFDAYYQNKTEALINHYKSKINQ